MPTNTQGQYTADIENFIADEVLPLAQRQLVAYQFGDPLELPKGRGLNYTATRFNRLPLPFAPLSEGVPPIGETMTISQVTATAQQWGDKVTITDVAELTIKHPLMKQANFLIGVQVAETLERNTYNALMALTQVNYVNSRGSRAALTSTDVLDPHTVNRTVVALRDVGAYRFNGTEMADEKIEAESGGAKASSNPRMNEHYASIIHPNVAGDFSENSTVVTAWSYSDINRLYNAEIGEWRGIRFCRTNMCPTFTGIALVTGAAVGGGALTAGDYYVQVTGQDIQNQYESQIYQVSGAITVGANGAISVTVPSTAGYTYNVYIGTTTSPANLGVSTSGPTSGPLVGQATQLAAGSTAIITAAGLGQTPPAAPATGQTVYPTFVFGRGAYAQVVLDNAKFTYLKEADKSDPLNQLRVIGWKNFYGTLISNATFMMRIESTSAFNATFG